MPSTITAKWSCCDCGADQVERNGVVMRCACCGPSRKFEPDREGTEEALRHRCARLEAALRGVIQAGAVGEHGWRLTLALHEAGEVLAGRGE